MSEGHYMGWTTWIFEEKSGHSRSGRDIDSRKYSSTVAPALKAKSRCHGGVELQHELRPTASESRSSTRQVDARPVCSRLKHARMKLDEKVAAIVKQLATLRYRALSAVVVLRWSQQ